ncbi:ATP-binding protein [Streptomyces anulatus]|uniref:ATP-binding protein n=1 Tax=Streptomyces anulatus TaxID=1892 RepID=UPI003642DC71
MGRSDRKKRHGHRLLHLFDPDREGAPVTNVMRHTGSPRCTTTLRRRPDGVRVTVSDSDTAPPERRAPEWSEKSGRGVLLIAALAAQCGTVMRQDGKDVWADIRATPPAYAA